MPTIGVEFEVAVDISCSLSRVSWISSASKQADATTTYLESGLLLALDMEGTAQLAS